MLHLSEKEFIAMQTGAASGLSDANQKGSSAGARSLSSGKAFEELIQLSCRRYLSEGKACILKTPEPFAVFSRTKDGMFTGRFTAAKAQPDFQGVISGGKSIIFEAKYTSKDRILQTAVTPTQADILDHHAALDGLCFVATALSDQYFFVPWEVWKDMKELFGRKYAKADDLLAYEVFPVTGNPFPFLDKCEVSHD